MKKTSETPLFTPEELAVNPYDAAELLDSDEMIIGYLTESLADPDQDIFLKALGNVLRAKGVANVAEATGLARESLYRTCQPGKKPHFDTIMKILRAVGLTVTIGSGPAAGEPDKRKAKPPTVKRGRKREAVTV